MGYFNNVMRSQVLAFVQEHGFKKCAEIGVWRGALSFIILDSTDVEKYYMVDPLMEEFLSLPNKGDPHYMHKVYETKMGKDRIRTQEELDEDCAALESKLERYGDRAQFIRKTSKEAAPSIQDSSLDFVFIDAIHLYDHLKEDLSLWLPKIKPGGYIAGDDYHRRYRGVMAAVDETFPDRVVDGRFWYHGPL